MKISRNWLNNYIVSNKTDSQLVHAFTLLGLECTVEKSNLIISSSNNYSLIYICKIKFDKDKLKEYIININYNDQIYERFEELIKSLKSKYNLVIH